MEPIKIKDFGSMKDVLQRIFSEPYAQAVSNMSPQERRLVNDIDNFWDSKAQLALVLFAMVLGEFVGIVPLVIGGFVANHFLESTFEKIKTPIFNRAQQRANEYIRERAWGLGIERVYVWYHLQECIARHGTFEASIAELSSNEDDDETWEMLEESRKVQRENIGLLERTLFIIDSGK